MMGQRDRGRPPRGGEARERALRTLLALGGELSVERDEGTLLRLALSRLVEAIGVESGVALLGPPDELSAAAEVNPSDALRDGAPDLARDAMEQGRASSRAIAGVGFLAATPLATPAGALGALVLHEPHDLAGPPEAELLEVVGRQLGTALDNVRAHGELRAAAARAEALSRLAATLSSGQEIREVVPAFARQLGEVQHFDRLVCGFVNDSGDYIEVVGHPDEATWGLGPVIPVVGSSLGFAVLNGKAVLERDLLHSHRFIEDMRLLEEGLRSYVVLPLRARGRSIGVVALGSRQKAGYDDAVLVRLQPIADYVALAFENLRLLQKTRELSITDEVTPLYNCRFFHQILERELKLVDRYRSQLSLVFIDLDRFKPINDTYGHLRGSRVLREVGFLLRAAVRETDYPARYGGDEFVVILPQTDGASARVLAEKLRQLVEGHAFLQEEGIDARIGVSLGLASYPAEASSKEALIRLADERMYADKEARRPAEA